MGFLSFFAGGRWLNKVPGSCSIRKLGKKEKRGGGVGDYSHDCAYPFKILNRRLCILTPVKLLQKKMAHVTMVLVCVASLGVLLGLPNTVPGGARRHCFLNKK